MLMKIKAQSPRDQEHKEVNFPVLGRVIPVRRVMPRGRVIAYGLTAQDVSRSCAFWRTRLDDQERKVELYFSKDSV